MGIEDTAGSGELLFGPSLGRANTASHLFLDLLSGPTPSWSAYVYVSFAGSLQLRQLCLTPFAAVQGYIWYALHAFPKFLYLLLFFPVLEYFFTKAVPELFFDRSDFKTLWRPNQNFGIGLIFSFI